MATVRMFSRSTQARTRWTNSPGESSAASINEQLVGVAHGLDVDAQGLCARDEKAQFLVEDEQCRPFAPRDRGRDVLQDKQGFAGASGTENERTRSCRDPAAQQEIELGNAALDNFAGKS